MSWRSFFAKAFERREVGAPPLPWVRWVVRGCLLFQMGIVSWDALALMEPYGLRRAQADCTAYLGAARSLLHGEGLRMPSLFEPLPYGWMSEWPLGYPALIAFSSWLTGIEPFYISRWLNVGLYILSYLIMLFFFKSRADWLFLFIYPPNYTWNVAFPLSENLFIPFFLLTIGSFERFYRDEKGWWMVGIGFLLPLLFLVRYSGLAVGIALGLWGLWQGLCRNWREGLRWLVIAAFQGLWAGGYFLWNALSHPAQESGLSMRGMPVPPDFFWRLWQEVPFLRFAFLVGLLTVAALWKWGRPSFSLAEQKRDKLLWLLFLTQGGLYAWSMIKGRVGIVDTRHFVLTLLPILLYAAERLWRTLPSSLLVSIAGIWVVWQLRNTYQHFRWSLEIPHLSYTYAERVRQAYDSLPPRSCIIGGSIAYILKGRRIDLCLGDWEGYFPLLLRDCPCLYVDCGIVDQRYELGLGAGILWPFVKYCDKPCSAPVCLRRIVCASSDPKSSDASP
ncbi:MAG: hypothetical protein RMK19_00750 [Bacteroidia bacterium]|nr:hypothetical protein [Bacteroidia bacterium]MDW8014522.1 hypothetical protein [Bacteroidia bacterium]